jgi:asparagine N-glycosylation enzyme membrane subunit Stt3
MKISDELIQEAPAAPNGPAVAALVAAGAGCAMMGFLYTLGTVSAAVTRYLFWYPPSGSLSGISSGAVIVWLFVWFWLHRRWSKQELPPRSAALAFGLLAVGLLLTFPPIARLF